MMEQNCSPHGILEAEQGDSTRKGRAKDKIGTPVLCPDIPRNVLHRPSGESQANQAAKEEMARLCPCELEVTDLKQSYFNQD